jgi:hypothetical protein
MNVVEPGCFALVCSLSLAVVERRRRALEFQKKSVDVVNRVR